MQVAVNGVQKNSPRCIIGAGLANHSKDNGGISIYYDGESITGLSFLIDTGVQQIPVKLPVKVDECLKVLKKEKRENPRKQIKDTREQAERVAWRILKDWVEAQMALLDIEMVRFEEIFLPYIETKNGQTIYERLEGEQFLLEG